MNLAIINLFGIPKKPKKIRKSTIKVEKILVVIYTERGDRNRIISARTATKDEVNRYYEQFYY